ncbi:MAG TPA: hypothetical protein VFB54_16685, partial [Burkholderiales bacterium]|nr:hypothetical protein [Burkholderiales bacterium]
MGAPEEDFTDIEADLAQRFGPAIECRQRTRDGITTLWIAPDKVIELLRHLKTEVPQPYKFLYDLTVIDECER